MHSLYIYICPTYLHITYYTINSIAILQCTNNACLIILVWYTYSSNIVYYVVHRVVVPKDFVFLLYSRRSIYRRLIFIFRNTILMHSKAGNSAQLVHQRQRLGSYSYALRIFKTD